MKNLLVRKAIVTRLVAVAAAAVVSTHAFAAGAITGGGSAQIEAGTVAFGASDKPLTPDFLRQHHLIQFPTAIAGEDVVYNLPGVRAGQLIVSGPLIADIFMGKITRWNDPAIRKLNPGLNLPDMPISVVHRSDGSGTTFTFANYLSKVSPAWKAQIGADT